MFDMFMQQDFLPVVACALTVFVLLWLRPSFFVNNSNHPSAPFCLSQWWATIVVFLVGAAVFYYTQQPQVVLDLIKF